MPMHRYDENGNIVKRKSVIDCQAAIEAGEVIRVEQSHKDEVNINNIIKRHGMDMIAKTAAITPLQYWDGDPTNDFQEMMNKITKAQETFDSLPSVLRKEFDNNPAKYVDYVLNPENKDKLIERGWMNAPEPTPEPVKVQVVNTPSETPTE